METRHSASPSNVRDLVPGGSGPPSTQLTSPDTEASSPLTYTWDKGGRHKQSFAKLHGLHTRKMLDQDQSCVPAHSQTVSVGFVQVKWTVHVSPKESGPGHCTGIKSETECAHITPRHSFASESSLFFSMWADIWQDLILILPQAPAYGSVSQTIATASTPESHYGDQIRQSSAQHSAWHIQVQWRLLVGCYFILVL